MNIRRKPPYFVNLEKSTRRKKKTNGASAHACQGWRGPSRRPWALVEKEFIEPKRSALLACLEYQLFLLSLIQSPVSHPALSPLSYLGSGSRQSVDLVLFQTINHKTRARPAKSTLLPLHWTYLVWLPALLPARQTAQSNTSSGRRDPENHIRQTTSLLPGLSPPPRGLGRSPSLVCHVCVPLLCIRPIQLDTLLLLLLLQVLLACLPACLPACPPPCLACSLGCCLLLACCCCLLFLLSGGVDLPCSTLVGNNRIVSIRVPSTRSHPSARSEVTSFMDGQTQPDRLPIAQPTFP
jgi:hypothetical protein